MSPTRLAKIESPLRVVLEFVEANKNKDLPGALVLLSEDCVFEETRPAPDGTTYAGKLAVEKYLLKKFENSSDAQIKVEEAFGMGFRCIVRWNLTWKNKSGHNEHLRGIDLYLVKDGLIKERLSYSKG